MGMAANPAEYASAELQSHAVPCGRSVNDEKEREFASQRQNQRRSVFSLP